MSFSGSGALRQLHDDCHPERSRFSGVAKDLPLRRLSQTATTLLFSGIFTLYFQYIIRQRVKPSPLH